MLFDLKGRRRRVVQGIYLSLAILMGGGLVLFGIGGEVQGGLFDAFSGGERDTASQAETELEQANQALAQDPRDTEALAEKVRAAYQLANDNVDAQTGEPTAASRDYLEDASEAWQAYLEEKPQAPSPGEPPSPTGKQPDPRLASLMVQVYDSARLDDPEAAAEAAELVALGTPTVGAYLRLTQYAAAAGQTRTADLAAREAVELAEGPQRKTVEQQAQQFLEAGEQAAKQGKGK